MTCLLINKFRSLEDRQSHARGESVLFGPIVIETRGRLRYSSRPLFVYNRSSYRTCCVPDRCPKSFRLALNGSQAYFTDCQKYAVIVTRL